MKSFAIGCTLVALGFAQRATQNDCFEQEEAEFLESCRNLFYPMCDKFNIAPTGTCNILTFGDASLEWFTQDISANYWVLMDQKLPPPPPPPTEKEEKEMEEEKNPKEDNEFAEWQWRLRAEGGDVAPTSMQKTKKDPCDDRTDCVVQCALSSEIPTAYKKSKELAMSTGVCGYKFQVTNSNDKVPFMISVLRAGAVSMALPVLTASAAAFALF